MGVHAHTLHLLYEAVAVCLPILAWHVVLQAKRRCSAGKAPKQQDGQKSVDVETAEPLIKAGNANGNGNGLPPHLSPQLTQHGNRLRVSI